MIRSIALVTALLLVLATAPTAVLAATTDQSTDTETSWEPKEPETEYRCILAGTPCDGHADCFLNTTACQLCYCKMFDGEYTNCSCPIVTL